MLKKRPSSNTANLTVVHVWSAAVLTGLSVHWLTNTLDLSLDLYDP